MTDAGASTVPTVDVRDLGAGIGYADGVAEQERCHAAIVAGGRETLLLLEHTPVYTLGRSADPAHVLASRDPAIAVAHTSRGGDVTYHGPGQLTGYPLLHLRRRNMLLLDYLQRLEECLILTLAGFGLDATRNPLNRGVWIGNDKIAAIGIRVSRGTTMHGFALNVNPDMAHYAGIIPCGLATAGVTSVAQHLPLPPSMAEVKQQFTHHFHNLFQ